MFIVIEEGEGDTHTYEIDTTEGEADARQALRMAGIDSAPVWHGDSDDGSAYKDSVHKLFAAK